MAKFVVLRKEGQEASFLDHLDDAITFLDYKIASAPGEWLLAEVIPMDSWWAKLLRFFIVKGK